MGRAINWENDRKRPRSHTRPPPNGKPEKHWTFKRSDDEAKAASYRNDAIERHAAELKAQAKARISLAPCSLLK